MSEERQGKESVYERCGKRGSGSGVGCGVVEWVKGSTLRWFGHIERMGNEEFVKKVFKWVTGRWTARPFLLISKYFI